MVDLQGGQVVMENMPYREDMQTFVVPSTANAIVNSDWRDSLPMLAGATVTLRELRASDAPSLFALLTTEEVSRVISPPPSTVEGFEGFIAWTLRQRTPGPCACFAVPFRGFDTAIGIFQVRGIGTAFASAEWGFAIGSAFWG